MQTAEFDVQDFAEGNNAQDKKLAIRFFRKAKQDPEASQREGRPIFMEHDYIQIMVPGDRNQVVVRPVAVGDKVRFGQQYDHWIKTQSNDAVAGTPLEAWNTLTMSQIEEYRYFGIRTIEQMGDLRDDICGKITGAITLKQKAQAFLAILKDEAPMKKVQAELDKRDVEMAAMRQAITEQAEIIRKLQLKK